MKDSEQGSPFHEGRGRGFDIPERTQPAYANAERGRPMEIDLDNLNRPGVGPMNYDKMNGKKLSGIEVGGIPPGTNPGR